MPNNLEGQNISDTYQRVVQYEDGILSDGTGSALPITISGNDVTITGNLNALSISSSRVTSSVVYTSGSSIFGDEASDTQTFIGNITASGVISASRMTSSFIHLANNNSSIKFGNGSRGIYNNGSALNIYSYGVNLISLYTGFTFNPNGWSSKNFVVNTNTDNTLYIASSKVAVGTDATTTALLTVDGELSASAISTEGSVSASLLTAPRISASNHIQTPEIRGVGDTVGLEVNGHLWLSGSTSHYLSASIVSASNLNATNISASYAIFGTPGSGHFTMDPTYGITGYETDSVSNKSFILGGGSQYGYLQIMSNGATAISLMGTGAAYFNRNIGFGSSYASNVGEAIYVTGNIEATGLIKTGHVTASGNISGSYLSMTSGSFNTLTIGSGSAPSNYGDVVLTSISASGNISASGDLTVNNITGVTSIDSTLYTIDGVNAIDYTSDTHLFGSTAKFTKLRSTVGIEMTSAVTASGDISSSGYIYSANEEHWEVSARVDSDNDTNWQGPNNYGIHTRADWNYDYGNDFDDITATVDVIRTEASTGWRVPYSASIIGFDLMAQPNSNVTLGIEQQFTCSLWHGQAGAVNTTSSLDANMGLTRLNHICSALSRQHPANTNSGMFKYNMYDFSASAADNSTLPYKVAKGDWIYPRFRANLFEDDGSDSTYAIYLSVKYKRIIG
tara:strand:+ start:2647 stop:4680 length:2034 start_codon:yes stop_codon:yes gene_type:complete